MRKLSHPMPQQARAPLESRLAYHLRCLREDATDPDLSPQERLTLMRDRASRNREIRRELEARRDRVGMWAQGAGYESPRAFRQRNRIQGD